MLLVMMPRLRRLLEKDVLERRALLVRREKFAKGLWLFRSDILVTCPLPPVRVCEMSLPLNGLGNYYVSLPSSRRTFCFALKPCRKSILTLCIPMSLLKIQRLAIRSERVEESEKEKVEMEEVRVKQADHIKQLKEKLKQSETDTHQLQLDRDKFAVECRNGEMVRRRIINECLPTFVRRLHQSADYKRSLAIKKGFIDGISIGRKDEDIQAILAATPNERVEESEKEKVEMEEVRVKQADHIKQLKEKLKQSETDTHQLQLDRDKFAVECRNGEMVRRRIINEYIQAILAATPNVDPASSNTFMENYKKLFDKRYPYVNKVARVYLLDPTGLQNVMSDETGLTPGQGPHDMLKLVEHDLSWLIVICFGCLLGPVVVPYHHAC
nr:hypothetical protein [Tanacetum cinerariifolium]